MTRLCDHHRPTYNRLVPVAPEFSGVSTGARLVTQVNEEVVIRVELEPVPAQPMITPVPQ